MELFRPVIVQHHGHLTLTLDFQDQILKMLYLRNGRADWHGTKRVWIERMLHPLCDFNLNSTMTLTLDFQGQILKKSYLRNSMADWHGMKGMWVDRMLDPCCDFQRSPHPWLWPWIFKVKFWKRHISEMGWPIDMERKECESIEYWTLVVTFNVHLNHDLDLWFSRLNLKKSYLRNGMADWHGMLGMWVDRMLDPCYDFQLSPHPWPWPWIFEVRFLNSYV